MKAERQLLLCNCAKTMKVDGDAIARALGLDALPVNSGLCRGELAKYEAALGTAPLLVACTQESALFAEVAEDSGRDTPRFFNIRETAGWSEDSASAAPKMAALAALAMRQAEPARLKTIESDGLCLVTGSGQQALEAATLLNRSLSVTLLLLDWEGVLLPTSIDFPVYSGRIREAKGSFGGFEIVVDGYAQMLPSSRSAPEFAMPRDGAKSNCSLIFDLTGGTPLFTRHQGRDGYFRPDPRDPAAVMRAVFEASGMAGEFEKPLYVGYNPEICAHSRSTKVGCSKCIDNCPAGAIRSDGDHVAIDAGICGGCGNCAAHCPTGAVTYLYPARQDHVGAIQTLASTHAAAGGRNGVLLLHDASGMEIINAMARTGRGLPASVVPLEMHSASGTGHDALLAAIASGFSSVVVLGNPSKEEEFAALKAEMALASAIVSALGGGEARFELLLEADPEKVEEALWKPSRPKPVAARTFAATANKRETARNAVQIIAEATGRGAEAFALPASAPYGAVRIDAEGCTLCMSCVSACPADALRDDRERPMLRFVENSCVQCGLCVATCPEKVMSLEPRLLLGPAAMQPVTLKEEDPHECTRCGKPFAAKSTIERISRQLAGAHRMFGSPEQIALIRMCDTCRLETLAEGGKDPFAIAQRPVPRTTDDYLIAEREGLDPEDFLKKS